MLKSIRVNNLNQWGGLPHPLDLFIRLSPFLSKSIIKSGPVVTRGTVHDDHAELGGSIGFDRHRRDIHSLLTNGVERELAQLILSDFSNIFRFYIPSTQRHHGCSDLASSLFGKSEHLHLCIDCGEFWNHAEGVHRVKAHPYYIERFILKREIESHVFFYKVFSHFSMFSKKEFRDERRNSTLRKAFGVR